MDWLDLLAVQGTLKSLFQPQFKSISSLAHSFLYSPALTSFQVCCDSSTGGRREKKKGESTGDYRNSFLPEKYPHLSPHFTHPHTRCWGRWWGRETQKRESSSSAHSQGYWDIVLLFAITVGPLCQKDWPNRLGKRSAQLVAMKLVPGDQRTGPGVEPGGHKGDKEIRHESVPGVPLTFSRGWKMTFSLSSPILKDSKEGTPSLQASHTSHPMKP